jgi:hypothetical protein
MVSDISHHSHSTGRGRLLKLKVAQFIDKLRKGDDSLYMTTQDLGVGVDGRPNLMAAPVEDLRGDFPLRPSILEV